MLFVTVLNIFSWKGIFRSKWPWAANTCQVYLHRAITLGKWHHALPSLDSSLSLHTLEPPIRASSENTPPCQAVHCCIFHKPRSRCQHEAVLTATTPAPCCYCGKVTYCNHLGKLGIFSQAIWARYLVEEWYLRCTGNTPFRHRLHIMHYNTLQTILFF